MIEYSLLPNGTEIWINKSRKHHRIGGPAIIHPDGTEIWYKDGKLHIEDAPEIIYSDGTEDLD